MYNNRTTCQVLVDVASRSVIRARGEQGNSMFSHFHSGRAGVLTAVVLLSTGVVGLTHSPTAVAQSGDGAIDEIVVSARKRSESIQEVPVAVTAVSSDTIVAASAAAACCPWA